MKMFKVYAIHERGFILRRTFQLVLARNGNQAASIAMTVWEEGGAAVKFGVAVARLTMPEGNVGLIYEGVQTMTRYPSTVSETV